MNEYGTASISRNRLHFACIIKLVRFGTNIPNYTDKIWES